MPSRSTSRISPRCRTKRWPGSWAPGRNRPRFTTATSDSIPRGDRHDLAQRQRRNGPAPPGSRRPRRHRRLSGEPARSRPLRPRQRQQPVEPAEPVRRPPAPGIGSRHASRGSSHPAGRPELHPALRDRIPDGAAGPDHRVASGTDRRHRAPHRILRRVHRGRRRAPRRRRSGRLRRRDRLPRGPAGSRRRRPSRGRSAHAAHRGRKRRAGDVAEHRRLSETPMSQGARRHSGGDPSVRGAGRARRGRETGGRLVPPAPAGVALKEERMFERILVPLDGSPRAEAVLPQIARILKREDSEILLLGVPQPPSIAFGTELAPPLIVDYRGETRTYLARLEKRWADEGIRVRALVEEGPPAGTILETAERENVTLIAMATHGRSGLARWVFGSVTEKVIRASAVPLLVLRSFPEAGAAAPAVSAPFGRILVPIVHFHLRILPYIKEFAALFGSRVSLLHVVEPGEDPQVWAQALEEIKLVAQDFRSSG